MELEAGREIERFIVEDKLGEGGMAVVYRVRHSQLGSAHALKLLTITHPAVRDRLLAEGRAQAALQHPNCVAVTDVLEVDGVAALVMAFVDGPTLEAWLEHTEPSPEARLEVFRGIVAGVQQAHSQGLIHRDLKPANVLMARTAQGWVPKVADFGLVKAVEGEGGTSQTRTGMAMGTPQYMAPEQITNAKDVDQRADIFSLGCILYRMFAGRPPFEGEAPIHVMNKVLSGTWPALPADVPPAVRIAVDGCLRTKADDRLPDCAALLAALDGHSGAPAAAPSSAAAPSPAAAPAAGPTAASKPAPPASTVSPKAALPVAGLLGGVVALGLVATLVLFVFLAYGTQQMSGPCPGVPGTTVGYVHAGGLFMKKQGTTWTLPRSKDVHEEMPTKANDYSTKTPVVCSLPRGTKLELKQAPERVRGKGYWVAVVAGAIEVPAEE